MSILEALAAGLLAIPAALAAIPPAFASAMGFALSWLLTVLLVECLKGAQTRASKAAFGLMLHAGFWCIGMAFILSHLDKLP